MATRQGPLVPFDCLFGFASIGDHKESMPNTAALLRRYSSEHDEEAFSALVRLHLEAVYSAALRRVGGDVHLAQDVTQQVFTALARKAGSLIEHPALGAWLHATTRNKAANVVRAERRRKSHEEEAQRMYEIDRQLPPEPEWNRIAPVLDDAIDRLNEADRVAVLSRFIDRRPFSEIGAMLRLTEDAARMRVDRALDRLRLLLHKRGVTSTNSVLALALMEQAVVAAPAGFDRTATEHALRVAAGTGKFAAILGFIEDLGTTTVVVCTSVVVVAIGVGLGLNPAGGNGAPVNAPVQAPTTAPSEPGAETRAQTPPASGNVAQQGDQPASPAFRQFAASIRITGVFMGQPPRALINQRFVRIGDSLDPVLGITLSDIQAAQRYIVLQDPSGAKLLVTF